jgi:hypothetical protein
LSTNQIRKWFRPTLERLTDRIAPATTRYWTGDGATANASDLLNWDNPVILGAPQPGDSLVFDGAHGVNSGKSGNLDAAFITGMISQQFPSIPFLGLNNSYNGTVTVQANVSITQVDSSATSTTVLEVAAGAQLTTHDFTLYAGSLNGSGSVLVTGTAASPGAVTFAQRPVTVDVSFLTTDANTTLTIGNNVNIAAGVLVTLNGPTNWNGGDITLANGSSIGNAGTFTVYGNNKMSGIGSFNMTSGGFIKDTGVGTTTITADFSNGTGVTTVKTGTLSFNDAFTSSAPLFVNLNAALTFAGSETLNTGTSFNSFQQSAGTLTFSGPTITLGNNAIVDATIPVVLTADPTMSGTGQATFNSHTSLTWDSGTIILWAVNCYGQLKLTGNLDKTLDTALLVNYGQATWDGTGNLLLESSGFTNYGTLDIQNDQRMRDTSPQGQASSFQTLASQAGTGLVKKSQGTGTTKFEMSVTSNGNLQLNGRTMEFVKGLQQGAAASVTDLGGGELIIDAGQTYNLNLGLLTGSGIIDGDLTVGGGTVELGPGGNPGTLVVIGNYTQSANGTLQIDIAGANSSGQLVVGGTASIQGGALTVAGVVPPTGTVLDFLDTGSTPQGSFVPIPAGYTIRYASDGAELTKL